MLSVVVTGAFGNVGRSTMRALIGGGHRVVAFDLPTPANRRAARRLTTDTAVVWGDVRDPGAVTTAIGGADAVVHLAALIPPHSDRRPELAEQVNVEGTRTVATAAASAAKRPRLVHASSLSVYGRTQHMPPPRRVGDPVDPCDAYGRTKAAAEGVVRASEADWVILRLGAVLPLRLPTVIDPLMFDVPLSDRIEFVHTLDVGLAAARACEIPELRGRTLHIGGGEGCQLRQGELLGRSLDALGIGRLPGEAFATTSFHCDWLDTDESQRLLGFQHRTFDDYVAELRHRYRWRRRLVRPVAPVVRRALLRTSPYWRAHREAAEVVPA